MMTAVGNWRKIKAPFAALSPLNPFPHPGFESD